MRHYFKVEEFAADVLLMFENCRAYNAPDAECCRLASNLQVCDRKTKLVPLTR